MTTFNQAFDDFFKTFSSSVSHGRQRDLFRLYHKHIKHHIGHFLLHELTHHQILIPIRILENSGKTRTSTVARLLINRVFDYSLYNDLCTNNPMYIVNKASKKHRFTHHHFVNTIYLPEFFQLMKTSLDKKHYVALQLIAYTACRSSEALGMKWQEVDFVAKEWKIPASRMKTKIQHTFFLSDELIDLLQHWKKECGSTEFAFPSVKNKDRPVSGTVIRKAILASKFGKKQTMHGFRHIFATTCYESNLWNDDAIELCIAHTTPSSRHFYSSKKFYNFAKHNNERKRIMEWYSIIISEWINSEKEKIIVMEV